MKEEDSKKEVFQNPEIEVILFDCQDVITTSGEDSFDLPMTPYKK